MGRQVIRVDAALAALAAALALGGAGVLGALLPGYSHLAHPLALPGATGLPHAPAFNLSVFVLPGVGLAALAWRLRSRLPDVAAASARLGSSMLLLSALGYAAQGLLPLDLETPDAGASRLHAVAWTVWWIAFLAGSGLMAVRLPALRMAAAGGWLLVLGLGVLAPGLLGQGISQRLAFGAWFAWMAWAGVALPRR